MMQDKHLESTAPPMYQSDEINMKRVYLYVTLLLLTECSNKTFIGKYRSIDSDEFGQINFEFKKDSVVEVTFWTDISGESKKIGKWYSRRDTIYTPNESVEAKVFSYEFIKNEDIKDFQIKVYDKLDNGGINVVQITLNEDEKPLRSEGNGLYKVDIAPDLIKVIKVKYLSQHHNIVVGNNVIGRSNQLNIYYDFNKSTHDFIYSNSWVLKHNKLYPLEMGHSVLIRKR